MYGLLWHSTRDRDQDHPQEKEMQKSKMAVWEALQIAVKRREAKSKGEKEGYTQLNADLQRIGRRDKNAFFKEHCKEIEENNGRDLQSFPFYCFPLFLCIDHWGRLSYLSLLFFELCIPMGIFFIFSFAFHSYLEALLRQPLWLWISFSWGWSWSLSPV